MNHTQLPIERIPSLAAGQTQEAIHTGGRSRLVKDMLSQHVALSSHHKVVAFEHVNVDARSRGKH